MEDIGLRAKIEGIGRFQSDAKAANRSMSQMVAGVDKSAAAANKATSSISGMVKPMLALGAAMAAAFAARAITQGIGSSIQAAASLNEAINKTRVTFDGAADDILAFSKTSASSLGMAQSAALDAAGSFAAMFKAMGLAEQERATMSKGLLQLAADLGSLYDVDPTEMLVSIRSGLVGEAEPLRRFGILLSEATVAEKAMQMGLAANKKELSETAKVQARYAIMLEQGAVAQGDFARTSKDFTNASRVARAEMENLSAKIGERLIPVVTPLIVWLGQNLPRAMDAIGPIMDKIGQAIGGLASQAGPALGQLGTLLAPVMDVGRRVGEIFLQMAREVGPPLLSMFQQVGVAIATAHPSFIILRRAFEALAGKGSEIQGALAGVSGVIRRVGDALRGIADPAGAAMTAMREMAQGVQAAINTILDMAMPMLEGVWERMVEGWNQIAPLIMPALEGIGRFVQGVLEWLGDLWEEHGGRILATVEQVWGLIGSIVQGGINVIVAIIKPFLTALSGDWAGAWELVREIPGKVWDAIVDVTEHFGYVLYDLLATIVKAIRLEDAWYSVRDFVLKVWHDITVGIQEQLNRVIGYVNKAVDAINAVASFLRLPTMALIKPIVIDYQFRAPPRTEWFADIGRRQMDLFKQNVAGAKTEWDKLALGLTQAKAPGLKEVDTDLRQAQASAAGAGAAMQNIGKQGKKGAAAAKDALKGLRATVQGLEADLREAQAAMQSFADPRLTGMQAAEDQLFDLDMAIKRTRLAELEAGEGMEQIGEAGVEAARIVERSADGMEDSFDLLSAQQRELAEGIPVPFQRAMWEIEQAQREAAQAEMPAPEVAEAPSLAPSAGEAMSEAERLERMREARQIMFDLTYEPMLRRLRETYEDLTGANEEITFEQAMLGLFGSRQEAVRLSEELEEQSRLLEEQEAALAATQEATAGISETRLGTAETETDITASYNSQLEALKAQKTVMDEMTAIKPPPTMSEIIAGGERYAPAGLQAGGALLTGGAVRVGEAGPETAVLPSGTRVIPHGAAPPAQVSRTWNDVFNIYGANQPIDVMDKVRRYQAFQRITQGR